MNKRPTTAECIELKPCPFCGHAQPKLIHPVMGKSGLYQGKKQFRYACAAEPYESCNGHPCTPCFYTHEEAIKSWNTRAQAPLASPPKAMRSAEEWLADFILCFDQKANTVNILIAEKVITDIQRDVLTHSSAEIRDRALDEAASWLGRQASAEYKLRPDGEARKIFVECSNAIRALKTQPLAQSAAHENRVVNIVVPTGYKTVREFLDDCGFELATDLVPSGNEGE